MYGVGLQTVGRLLDRRKRRTTAIYARLDDAALQDVATHAAAAVAEAIGYRAEAPPLTHEPESIETSQPVSPLAESNP